MEKECKCRKPRLNCLTFDNLEDEHGWDKCIKCGGEVNITFTCEVPEWDKGI